MDVTRMLLLLAVTLVVVLCVSSIGCAQEEEDGLLKVGGFRCVDLKSHKNDASYDLYEIGYFCYASFRMDVWKRHGVPFWYPRETGNIRVAGPEWKKPALPLVSAGHAGAVADAGSQQPGNGAIHFANDADTGTYWFAGESRSDGKLWIEFARLCRVDTIRFLGWAMPKHAPKDYSVGLILADGSWKEVALVTNEERMGEWISFPVAIAEAKGIYLDIRSTVEGQNGPVIYELQALGETVVAEIGLPLEVVIPLGSTTAEEIFFLGNVGNGFDTTPDTETPVGEYVLRYEDGREEVVPLVAGKNVADFRYGHFVPEAEFAFGFKDKELAGAGQPGTGQPEALYYHMDEMLAVEPKKQLQMFSHTPKYPDRPLDSLKFRCTNPDASLVLAGLTLRQSGPRMNALIYNGKVIKPYPENTPKAAPSMLDSMRDNTRILSLDGQWRYVTDPGNRGIRHAYYKEEHDASEWAIMPVPSQWYVEGIDYHGVVWFRREFDVPAEFPGSVLKLEFGGVDYDARVWVNDEYVGRHSGAFASFELDATRVIKKGRKNLIVVRVDSPIDPGYSPQKTIIKGNSQDDICMPYNEEGCSGGIFRSLSLVGRGDVGIENAWASSTLSKDLKHADVTIRFELGRSEPATGPVDVRCTLTEPDNGRVFRVEKSVSPNGLTSVEVAMSIDDPMLWYPWEQGTPHLHTMQIEVSRGDQLLDRHVSRVGIRQVDLNREEKCLYVNYHRIFIKGMLNDDIHWMSMMDRTGYRQRIQLQKDANLNLIRMVGHQSSPDMYDLCDEMGMMIWQEMPLQWGYSSTEPVREDILDVVRETTIQCRPHASVIGWSAWNEGGQPGFSERITDTIGDLDDTRPMSRSSGGDFDIHIYPNIIPAQMSRRTFFWTGLRLGYVSEVGAYGLSSLDEMREIVGDDLMKFDSADYYWETFNSYRYNDGPVFWDSPFNGYWSTDRIKRYVLDKAEPSQRWLVQFMKFMYESMRAQMFDPTTAAIHCRFDDAMPTAFLGVVNFSGRPRKAYYSVQQACQQVLPILFFDFTGAEDVRVVNEYWYREWQDCKLKYSLTDRNGTVIREQEKSFDLPADSTVKVLTRQEIGDIFHVSGGFFAHLTVHDSNGKLLSENRYDLTADEIEAFVTSVYPVPPVEPINSVIVKASEKAKTRGDVQIIESKDTYSDTLVQIAQNQSDVALTYNVEVPWAGDYLVRVACDSGQKLRSFELLVDDKKADLESYPYTDMNLGMTRLPYSAHGLSWHPGWTAHLSEGNHSLELRWPGTEPAPGLLVDAICLQHCLDKNNAGHRPDYRADESTADNKDLK